MNTDKTIATKFKEKKLSLVKPEGETKEPQWEYVEEEVDILDQTYWEKLVWYARKPAFLKHVAEKMYDDNLEWVGEIDGVLIDKEAFLFSVPMRQPALKVYAKTNLDQVLKDIKRIQINQAKYLPDGENDQDGNWQHGFNSGCLAILREIDERHIEEEEYPDVIFEDRFPNLDT